MSLRGRGKVVPRKAQQQQQAPIIPLLQKPTDSSSAVVLASSNGPPAPAQTQDLAPAPVTHADSSSEWRCVPAVIANSQPVQQLPPSQLSSAAGVKLLRSGHPVLIKQLQLATCSLAKLGSKSAGGSGLPSAAADLSSAPATQVTQHQQQGPGQCCSSQAAGPLEPQPRVSVLCSPATSNRFIAAEASKNAPGSYYHVRKPETTTLQLEFNDWLHSWQDWTHHRLLLQANVCGWEITGSPSRLKLWPNKAVCPHLTHLLKPTAPAAAATVTPVASSTPPNQSVAGSDATLTAASSQAAATAAQQLLDWGLLQQLCTTGQWLNTGSLQLLAGGRDALLPACYDTSDRLLCQVSGRQQLLLLPPSLAFRGLYPYPVHHPYDHYSAVDWEDADLGSAWPGAEQVGGCLCELSPGDTLLVPAYWFVHRQLIQPACVSLELQLTPQPERLVSPAALQVQVSRMMEVWFAAEAGPANVRRWLQALAEGREWQLLEQRLMTAKGYKLLQCCHMTLQQLQQVLALESNDSSSSSSRPRLPGKTNTHTYTAHSSNVTGGHTVMSGGQSCSETTAAPHQDLEAAARQLVGLMCEGRLVPTPWLNEAIPDALYLQHPPQYHLVEEDAEAVRYSSLFRHRLIANKPDWMKHAIPLQLAPTGSRRSLREAAGAGSTPPAPALPSTTAPALPPPLQIDGQQ